METMTMNEITQGRIYAGRLSDGSPAVVRVQNMTPELCQVVRLDSDMMGREGYIATSRLADSFRLVSDGPGFTSEQVAGWLAEAACAHEPEPGSVFDVNGTWRPTAGQANAAFPLRGICRGCKKIIARDRDEDWRLRS